MKPGCVYFVRQEGNPIVKIGMHKSADIEAYLYVSYGRSMTPLVLEDVVWTSNARLAEALVHHLLDAYRIDPNRELFDLSSEQAVLEAEQAKRTVRDIDVRARVHVPWVRPIDLRRYQVAQEAAKEGTRRSRKRKAEREAEAIKAERKAKTERDESEKKHAEEQAKLQQQAVAAEVARQLEDSEREAANLVEMWLSTVVEEGEARDYVKVCELWNEFRAHHKTLQSNKKTMKKAKHFDKDLNRCLGQQYFKQSHQFVRDGRNAMVGKVYMRYRWIEK